MDKKNASTTSTFEYNCNCGMHFVNVGDAVTHVNKFAGHQLSRIEK